MKTHKYCPRCRENLPCKKFSKNMSRDDGLEWCCKMCRIPISKKWYKKYKLKGIKNEVSMR